MVSRPHSLSSANEPSNAFDVADAYASLSRIATIKSAEPVRLSDKDSFEDISKVFRIFDESEQGTITLNNLRRVARELGESISNEELMVMIECADSDGDGRVTVDDFYNVMTKKASSK